MASMDEAYLNITAYLRAHPEATPLTVATEIQQRILALTKLTCSIGIAANKMLAKICTDMRKPNGVFQLANDRDAILSFLRPLAVRKISGIGKVTEKLLQALGITTCGELFDQRRLIFKMFHESSAYFFLRAAMGISSTQIVHRDRKSISTERTFRNLSQPSVIFDKCYDIVAKLAATMQSKELVGRTLTVKLKATSFAVKSKSVTLAKPTNTAEEMFDAAVELVRTEFPISIRLLGIRCALARVCVFEYLCGVRLFAVRALSLGCYRSLRSMCRMSALRRVDEPEDAPEPGQRRIDQLLAAAAARSATAPAPPRPPHSPDLSAITDTPMPPPPPPPAPEVVDLTLSPCPVCGADGFRSEDALTRHVDACLQVRSLCVW